MFDLKKLVRPSVLELEAYSSARDDFSGKTGIFLDANENPYGKLNRYPDPYQNKLKEKLSSLNNISEENIFLGNGSDEIIDLSFRIFCRPAADRAMIFPPTYGMYKVSADINEVEMVSVPLTDNFEIDLTYAEKHFEDKNLKLIFVCRPNNPTANSFERESIKYICKKFKGIIFLDEAYIDFSETESFLSELPNYPNLIISRTLSKAYGHAGIRVGAAYADKEIIRLFNKVKPPYNISRLNQEAALDAISRQDIFLKNRDTILAERNKLLAELNNIPAISKIYPSDANFILIKTENADEVYRKLVEQKIIIRNRSKLIPDTLRITVGTPEENRKFIEALKKI